jgi:hypothetical protein
MRRCSLRWGERCRRHRRWAGRCCGCYGLPLRASGRRRRPWMAALPGRGATFRAAVPVQRLRGRPDSSCLHHRLHIRQRPASADEASRVGALMLNRVPLPSELSAYDEHDHRGGSNRFCHPAPPDVRCQRPDWLGPPDVRLNAIPKLRVRVPFPSPEGTCYLCVNRGRSGRSVAAG